MEKVALISTHTSLYKLGIWPALANSKSIKVDFFCSTYGKWGIKTFDGEEAEKRGMVLHEIANKYAMDKHLVYQTVPFFKILKKSRYGTLLLPGEITCLSTWLILFATKFTGQKTIIWTHGMYGRETRMRQILKKWFYKIPSSLFVYGHHSKKLLKGMGFSDKDVTIVYNSLDYDSQVKEMNLISQKEMKALQGKLNLSEEKLTVLVIGRLNEGKNLELLIDAAKELAEKNHKFNFLIVGGGEPTYVQSLKDIVKSLQLDEYFFFTGPEYDTKLLSQYILISDFCVIPGAIGLSAIHCLTYGVPVISHNDFRYQGPEVEAILDGVSGYLFERDSLEDLVEKMMNLSVLLKDSKEVMQKNSKEIIEKFYNPHVQEKIMVEKILNG